MTQYDQAYSPGKPFQKVLRIPIIADRAPVATDLNYKDGQVWIDQPNLVAYIKIQSASGAATWEAIGGGSASVATLTGDSGGAIAPVAGDITIAGGTNITTAGTAGTITVNLDDAISLATSVTSPLYLAPAATDLGIRATAGQDVILRAGDDAGADKISIHDVNNIEVAYFDSSGSLTTYGDIVRVDSLASGETTIECTNSDNTMADSDAFFEVAVGGTSSGNPGIRFQISGGQNYSMGIDNASASDDLLICGDNDIGTDPLLRIAELGDVTLEKGDLILNAAATQMQMQGGAATDFIGQATLVAGTITISNTNIAAGDKIFVSRQGVNGSTALGVFDVAITPATSFSITARKPGDATTETNDVSIVDYVIIRQI